MAVENTPARIGKSVVICGEVKGSEDLIVDGRVEGTVTLSESRLTIGPNANVAADLSAKDVLVLGHVQGNVVASGRVELRAGCVMEGDIGSATRRRRQRRLPRPGGPDPGASPGLPRAPAFRRRAALLNRKRSGPVRPFALRSRGVLKLLGRWFEKKHDSGAPAARYRIHGPRVPRHSGGWAVLRKRLQAEPGLRIIDVGYTSPANINYLTSLGHSVFLADLVHDACTDDWKSGADEDGNPLWNVRDIWNRRSIFPDAPSTLSSCGPRWIICPSRWWRRWSIICMRP